MDRRRDHAGSCLRRTISNDGNGIVLASWSKNNGGTCWYAADNQAGVNAVATPLADAPVPRGGSNRHRRLQAPFTVTSQGHTSCNAAGAVPAFDASEGAWVQQTSALK